MAMAVCGLPRFRSADRPGQIEVLKYLGDDDVWALVAGVPAEPMAVPW